MFAGKLVARTSATEDRFGGVGKISGWPVIFLAAPLAVAKEERAIPRMKKSDQLSLQDHSARILDGRRVRRLRIDISFINFHGWPPNRSRVGLYLGRLHFRSWDRLKAADRI